MKTSTSKGWGVEYQVLDYGCGIGDEIKDKIFNQFFSTKGAEGIGIGLMVTKKIVDEHKGIIEVDCQKTSHTKFIIRLP